MKIELDGRQRLVVDEAADFARSVLAPQARVHDETGVFSRDVLAQMKGNKLQAAKALGISRRGLYRLLEKYGLASKAEPTEPATPGEHRPAPATEPGGDSEG